MYPAIDRTFKIDEPLLSNQIKIEYAKQNANQLSGELVSLAFIRVMEQASKEGASTDTTESL